MARNRLATFIGSGALMASVASSTCIERAEVNCEGLPAGPARTDCYIGLSLINRQQPEIAAGVARQRTDSAVYRQLTGRRPKPKWHRAPSDR